MANPTTNFGWVMPTSSSLVTNLPADFNTFGQAVDTSMAQLKGGTTGQILSKTSATDMAFTWITNDVGDITAVTAGTGISGGGTSGSVTITNSMATEITAKGDLIVGTGNAAFDNLPAGTNGHVLTADSTVSPTGLKWAAPAAGGKVLQVVSATYAAETDNSSTTYADTGLTATITPTSATSTILVMISNTMGKSAANSNNAINVRIMRGATEILENKQLNYTGNAEWSISQYAMTYLDSPATTSATTYKLQFKQWFNNGALVRAQNDGSKASIVLMEIGA